MNFLNPLKRNYNLCKNHALRCGVPIIAVLIDYMYSKLRIGINSNDYFINSDGYRNKLSFKKKLFRYQHRIKISNDLNDKDKVNILDDKGTFHEYFTKLINHGYLNPKESSFEDFKDFISSHPNLLSKPLKGECGIGIQKYEASENLMHDYNQLISDSCFLEELVIQDKRLIFNNKSLNTLRIYTILDKKGIPHVLKAILRVGVGNTLTDNYHTGGVIYPINVQTGIIESFGKRKDSDEDYYIHPYTDIVMLGFKIPDWNKVIATVKRAANTIPEIRYVGWDVALTEKGIDIIEGNTNADHALFERIGLSKYWWPKIKHLSYGK